MTPLANVFIRVGSSGLAYFLFVLVLCFMSEPSAQAFFLWLVYALFGLAAAWKGILALPLLSFVIGLLIDRLPSKVSDSRAVRFLTGGLGDLLSGLVVSWIFYGGHKFFFAFGLIITGLYTIIFQLLSELPHWKIDTPTAD